IGAVIDVRVTAASIARVKYYAPAGADSLLHRISGDRVQKIEYEDGRVWERRPAHIRQIDRKAEKRIVRNNISSRAYPNVITLNAPHLVLLQSLTGIACGLEYERFLDPRGYWSLHLPAYLTTKVSSDIYGGIRRGDVFEEGKAQYAAPGVLFHPLGNKRRADIGLGIQY